MKNKKYRYLSPYTLALVFQLACLVEEILSQGTAELLACKTNASRCPQRTPGRPRISVPLSNTAESEVRMWDAIATKKSRTRTTAGGSARFPSIFSRCKTIDQDGLVHLHEIVAADLSSSKVEKSPSASQVEFIRDHLTWFSYPRFKKLTLISVRSSVLIHRYSVPVVRLTSSVIR